MRRSVTLSAALGVAMALTVAPAPPQIEVVSTPKVVEESQPVQLSTASTVRTATPVNVEDEELVDRDPGTEVFRSETIATTIPFSMIGFELPDGPEEVRVRAKLGDGAEWGEWHELERVEEDDRPDPGSDEAAQDRSHRFTEPLFVAEADRFQVEVDADALPAGGEVADLEAVLLDTDGLSGGPDERKVVRVGGPVAEASDASRRPNIVSRSQWGAQAPRSGASYASNVDLVVVHHTAGNNSYTQAQAAGQVRGIQSYHRNTLGWKDMGYNVLIDRFGTIYEGREGGLERAVIGAHAANYNTGSFGVSVMGNFVHVDAPQAAYNSLRDVIAWQSWLHGIDPMGTSNRTYQGSRVRTVSGHRDVGQTACPGRIQDRMWWLRTEAAKMVDAAPPASSGTFRDVDDSSPHRPAIERLHEEETISGFPDGTYRPADGLTRGQMATIFARSMGLGSKHPDGEFRDVDINTSHAGHITAIVDAGVVSGYPDGTYRPNQRVTRAQMATFLSRAKGIGPRDAQPFTDVGPDNAHYRWVAAAHGQGWVWGFAQDQYLPNRDLRRDEAANMVDRAFPSR